MEPVAVSARLLEPFYAFPLTLTDSRRFQVHRFAPEVGRVAH